MRMVEGQRPGGYPSRAGLTFGPNGTGKTYLSRKDHWYTSSDRRRNKWAKSCQPPDEYSLFCDADTHSWYGTGVHLWGLRKGLLKIGTTGERIALFRAPANATDPWHGYPVSARDPQRELEHRPDPELVQRWLEEYYIDSVDAARINRGKV